MPLHADHPPPWVVAFDTFDGAVVCSGAHTQRPPEAIHRLMMNRVHAKRLGTEDRCKPRGRFDAHAMHARVPLVVHLV
jgi:hypothetical protein